MLPANAVFDEVYVISDLHMGGVTGFQIFDAGSLLAATIDHLIAQTGRRQIALVINGDMVDFLAEPNATYFDAVGAAAKLERIVADEAFAAVWQALQRFVRSKRRTLYINLGNHDLELALPSVRQRLLEILTEGKSERRGNIHLVLDGTGVRCRVGTAEVLCLHGNEVDTWNVCGYEELRRQGRDLHYGMPRDPWIPNAGTKMVIDVMNDIKRRYPFVDLLKPEVQAVIPTLFALDPGIRPQLTQVIAVAGRLARDQVLRWGDFLEANSVPPDLRSEFAAPPPSLDRILAESFAPDPALADQASDDTFTLLRETEWRFHAHVDPLQLISPTASEQLGIGEAISGWFLRKPKPELLREALQSLATDQSFSSSHADGTFERLDELVGPAVDFLVTGHTHQQRALVRPGGGCYFNSGTWARLIQLRPEILSNAAAFERYYRAMERGTLAALDEEPEMILRRPTVVTIRQVEGRVEGMLQGATCWEESFTLQTIPGTLFTKA